MKKTCTSLGNCNSQFQLFIRVAYLYCFSPDDPREVSITCSGRRGGALLDLPLDARREDTLAQSAFGEWIVKHIDDWFEFARELQLGIQRREGIILVTGCDRTRSWTNVAFLEGWVNANGSYKVKAVEGANDVEVQYSSGHVAGGVLKHGPRGTVRVYVCQRIWSCFSMTLCPTEPTRESMCIYPRVSCRPSPQNTTKQS